MIREWIEEIKNSDAEGSIGMILIHNGVVRATSRDGRGVSGMRLDFDERKLREILDDFYNLPGISHIKVWINKGELKVGDDIMYVLVAGRTRQDVLGTMDKLLERIKGEVVREEEIYFNP